MILHAAQLDQTFDQELGGQTAMLQAPELKYGDNQIELIKNDVTIRTSVDTPALRIAKIAAAF